MVILGRECANFGATRIPTFEQLVAMIIIMIIMIMIKRTLTITKICDD